MAEHLEPLIQAGAAKREPANIAQTSRDGSPPASPAQERLWKLHRALPELPYFNILYMLRLSSPVDAAILERALNEIVRRHEILRTTFAVARKRLIQIIAPRLTVPLDVSDLRKLSKPKKESAAHRLIKEELLHSFDLALGPLVRVRLVRLAEEEHLLLIGMHQSLVDGWSVGVLAEELAALYGAFAAGEPSPLPPLPIQFADFAAWQRQWRSHPEVAAQLGYWREKLHGPLATTTLATARRKSIGDDLRTAQRDLALPAELADAVKQFSHREGGTLFMALVAALMILMHRHAGADDLRVATNVANRNRPGAEGLIGPLVNTVILRTLLDGNPTPREVLHRVRATTLAAFANQDLPFEDLSESLARDQAVEPADLARVMILLHNAALRPAASPGPGLAYEEANPGMPMPLVTTTTYDVILTLRESAQGLVGACIYKPYLFDAKSIDRLLREFRKVLENMVAYPERPISAARVPPKRKP
jgi:non-ribosomal peptide synthetase component F